MSLLLVPSFKEILGKQQKRCSLGGDCEKFAEGTTCSSSIAICCWESFMRASKSCLMDSTCCRSLSLEALVSSSCFWSSAFSSDSSYTCQTKLSHSLEKKAKNLGEWNINQFPDEYSAVSFPIRIDMTRYVLLNWVVMPPEPVLCLHWSLQAV